MTISSEPFVIERAFDASVQKIWKALTDKNQMKKWYFDVSGFKPVVGFEFSFEAGNEGKNFVHLCKITEVQVYKKLAYTWKYKGYTGESLVTFELFPGGNTTRLKLTHSGLETFPADTSDFLKENFAMGWTDIIGRSLKEHLEKQSS